MNKIIAFKYMRCAKKVLFAIWSPYVFHVIFVCVHIYMYKNIACNINFTLCFGENPQGFGQTYCYLSEKKK